METKKNKKYQIKNYRLPSLFVGLNYITAIVLATFTYRVPVYSKENEKVELISANIIYEEVFDEEPKEIISQPQIKKPKPQKEIDLNQEVKTIDNTNKKIDEKIVEVVDIDFDETFETTETIGTYDPIVDFPDIEASFGGGYAKMAEWLQKNLKYPKTSIELDEQGKVYLRFIVERDGRITNVEIIKGVSKELNDEAKRLIKNMPKWTPGEVKGVKVRSMFTMPINFQLQ